MKIKFKKWIWRRRKLCSRILNAIDPKISDEVYGDIHNLTSEVLNNARVPFSGMVIDETQT